MNVWICLPFCFLISSSGSSTASIQYRSVNMKKLHAALSVLAIFLLLASVKAESKTDFKWVHATPQTPTPVTEFQMLGKSQLNIRNICWRQLFFRFYSWWPNLWQANQTKQRRGSTVGLLINLHSQHSLHRHRQAHWRVDPRDVLQTTLDWPKTQVWPGRLSWFCITFIVKTFLLWRELWKRLLVDRK